MNHETAAHALRVLCIDRGAVEDEDALNFLLDELKQVHKDNARLILERDTARREVAKAIEEQTRRNLRTVKAIAEKGSL